MTQLMLPGQAAAPAGPVDLSAMYLVHHAFRRDLTAFCEAVARVPIAERATWRALARRWDRFHLILHKHHTGEDSALWPLLRERAAGDVLALATLDGMESEHAEIDPLLVGCDAGFGRLGEHADEEARDALLGRLRTLAQRLHRHLEHEESEAMALVQRLLSQADWERLDKEFQSAYGMRELPFMASWALYGLRGEQLREVLAKIDSKPLELLWSWWWRRSFERGEKEAFGR
ncbi:hemerythrin domain-containing protein [Nonomuraea sp. NPDC050663]|uniref:hemerythrin domain-containing protein n=1 Tax=Nonomuraea sp. NPDC050663 TaxID=3364370 RepID=UPI0037AE91F0